MACDATLLAADVACDGFRVATPAREAAVRVNGPVIRAYGISSVDTPEDCVNDEARIPGHPFAIGNPTTFSPKMRADQRLCFSMFRFSVKWSGALSVSEYSAHAEFGFSRHEGLPIRCVFWEERERGNFRAQ